jgi:hypothetical protein
MAQVLAQQRPGAGRCEAGAGGAGRGCGQRRAGRRGLALARCEWALPACRRGAVAEAEGRSLELVQRGHAQLRRQRGAQLLLRQHLAPGRRKERRGGRRHRGCSETWHTTAAAEHPYMCGFTAAPQQRPHLALEPTPGLVPCSAPRSPPCPWRPAWRTGPTPAAACGPRAARAVGPRRPRLRTPRRELQPRLAPCRQRVLRHHREARPLHPEPLARVPHSQLRRGWRVRLRSDAEALCPCCRGKAALTCPAGAQVDLSMFREERQCCWQESGLVLGERACEQEAVRSAPMSNRQSTPARKAVPAPHSGAPCLHQQPHLWTLL